jgi:hypothetical protein
MTMPSTYGELAKFRRYGNRLATTEASRLFNSAIELDSRFCAGL